MNQTQDCVASSSPMDWILDAIEKMAYRVESQWARICTKLDGAGLVSEKKEEVPQSTAIMHRLWVILNVLESANQKLSQGLDIL